MGAFACGRCDECDGGRGHEYCLKPRGVATFRCACGRVGVMRCDRCAPHPDSELLARLLAVLGREVGKTGASEGAVDVAERLIRERDEARTRAEQAEQLARQGEANEAKLHEALGWAGEWRRDLPVATRATLEVVAKLRQAERERDEAKKTCPLLGDRLGSPGIIERSLAVKCLCVEPHPSAAKEPAR